MMEISSQTSQSKSLQLPSQLAEKMKAAGLSIKGLLHLTTRFVFVLGILALGILTLLFAKPDFADKLLALSPFESSYEAQTDLVQPLANLLTDAEAPIVPTENVALSNEVDINAPEKALVTRWLAKRYRVAEDAIDMMVSATYTVAQDIKLDPLLILSVIAIESRFNPFAESPMGAQGLMQVMSKIHHDKFKKLGGIQAALNPVANVRVGSSILKEYVSKAGSIEGGLKMYVGAANLPTDGGYGAKVLSEYANLKRVSAGNRVPLTATHTPKKSVASTAATKTEAQLPQLTVNEHQETRF
jgi:hypothetical protein